MVAQGAEALFVFLGPSLTVSAIRLVIIFWYIKKHKFKSNIKDNFILGINRIVSILNTVFFALAFMVFLGVDPIKFLTSITIVAAAIANICYIATLKHTLDNEIGFSIIVEVFKINVPKNTSVKYRFRFVCHNAKIYWIFLLQKRRKI